MSPETASVSQPSSVDSPPAPEADGSQVFTFPNGRPAAILWDMDGTLIDTEPYWMGSEADLVREHGGEWSDEDGLAMVGMQLVLGAKIMQDRGVALEIEEIVEEIVSRVGAGLDAEIPWQPGALDVLTALRDAGVPMALVTASYDSLAERFVNAAPTGTFSAVVTGEQVAQGKPHPEPYFEAARRLGVNIADCVIFEDSHPGVASALASGAASIGVRSAVPLPAQAGLSRIANLAQVTDGLFASVLSGQPVDLLGDTE